MTTISKDEILAMVAEGLSDKLMAERMGTYKNKIVALRKAYNIEPAKAYIPPVDIPEIELRQMVEGGVPLADIANHFGVERSAIDRRIAKLKLASPNAKRATELTPELRDGLQHNYIDLDLSVANSGAPFGLSIDQTRTCLTKMGIYPKPKKPLKPKEQKVRRTVENTISEAELRQAMEVDKMTLGEASEFFDFDKGAIARRMQQLGIENPHLSKKFVADYDTLYDLYVEKELNFVDISKFLGGVSNVTLRKRLHELGIPQRPHSSALKLVAPKMTATKIERYGQASGPDQPFVRRSAGEKEVQEFLNSIGGNFHPTRSLLWDFHEVDLYDEQRKLAIEYNGEWYHCERFRPDPNYHRKKYDYLQAQGIRLIMINEQEWKTRKPQWQDYLRSLLNACSNKVGARKCHVKKLDEPDKDFIDASHIQGKRVHVTDMYGLFFQDEMVGAVSFGPHHRGRKFGLTLNRLCFKPDWSVAGGAIKLVRAALEDLNCPVTTWSDTRLTPGDLYGSIGFRLVREVKRDYCYVSSGKIRKKQTMTRKKTGCPDHLSEKEWNKQNGWYRMWDCGRKSWVWKP